MRQKVEHYNGTAITKQVLNRINFIDLKRFKEGITKFSIDKANSLKSLCKSHDTQPEQEHIIIGQDWYIIYVDISSYEIEIKDWVAIHNVENKFMQTMEMFNAFKQILIEHQDYHICGTLRHSTSYQFYKRLVEEGYLIEHFDMIEFDEPTQELTQIKEQILSQYNSLYDYFNDANREKYQNAHIEDYIYHDVLFQTSNKFVNKYQSKIKR